jgi:hypothetical protein
VIGYLEPHDRAETEAQADGLDQVAPRRLTYRDVDFVEMDLPAVLERSPELCLVDELAHTNAPGVEHGKRYQDIADLRLGLRPVVGLEVADHDVPARLELGPPLLQHAVGLADSGGHAQEHFVPTGHDTNATRPPGLP